MQNSDDILVQRAMVGDSAALATLLLGCESKLISYIKKRLPLEVRGTVAPEDVLQETSYEACRLISGFIPTGSDSFARWLTRIADLRIKAAITKHRRRRTSSVSNALNDDQSVLSALAELIIYRRTPSKSALAHELAIELERSLSRLPADYRAVLNNRYLEGMTVAETAEAMARSHEQVYLLSTRALQSLRHELSTTSRAS